MSCYRPNGVIFADGKFGGFIGAMSEAREKAFADNGYEIALVPCGKCIGCRLDKSKDWSDRMLAEYISPGVDYPARTATFCTLTYDDDHVPWIECTDGVQRRNLDVKSVQDFHKRLRKYYHDNLDKHLRYYYAGEYGDHTFRPHGHAIYYGMSIEDWPDLHLYKKTDYGILYRSPKFEEIWENGQILFASASYQTFAYCARYVVKKQFVSEGSNMVYMGRHPPFSLKSINPALGTQIWHDYDDPIMYLSDGSDSHRVRLPKIVSNKLAFTDPELYDILKQSKRALCSGHSDLLKAQLGSDYYAYLEMLQSNHEERTRMIHRDLGG